VSNKGVTFVVIIIIALIASFAWTYLEYTKPITEHQNVLDYAFSYNGWYEQYSTVQEDNPLYPLGTQLSSMAGYFYTISPISTISFIFEFKPTTSDATLSFSTKTELILSETNENGIPFWEKKYFLSSKEYSDIAKGELSNSFTLNAWDIRDEIEEIADSVGRSVGQSSGVIITSVNYQGSISSTPFEGEEIYELPVVFGNDYYAFDISQNSTPTTKSYFTSQIIERSKTFNDLLIPIGAIVACVIVLVGFVICTKGSKDEDKKFHDWISIGTYPKGKWDKEIFIPELKGLVDIAIDHRKRVILDQSKEIYFILDGKNVYYHTIIKTEDSKESEKEE